MRRSTPREVIFEFKLNNESSVVVAANGTDFYGELVIDEMTLLLWEFYWKKFPSDGMGQL